ncbi:MAG: HAD family phosphatase [Formivibrio sp.]|nr:HAD family phosphatase [Formivibrio sp.]
MHQAPNQTASPVERIRAAIFDMDGLMLDSERLALACWRDAAKHIGAPIHEEAILGMVGMHTSRTRQWLIDQFGPDYPADAMQATCHEIYMLRTQREAIPLRPGILEMLDWLESINIPKAVATSTRRSIALHHLEMAGLLSRFQFVVCGDDVAHPKPAPDIYHAVLCQFSLPATACVVFEDSDFGAQAAHAAGCRLVIVPDLRQPSHETRALGAPIVASLHEARELIKDW